MNTSRWFTYGRLSLATVGLAAALACATATATLYNVRFDLSPGDRFTLSDHALTVLRAIDKPVKVTAFIRTRDGRNPVLKDLLWQAARENPLLRYEIVDVNKHPARAGRMGVSTYGASVVESGSRRADFSIPSENHLIAAVIHVTAPPAALYALTGHGECDLQSPDSKRGCSRLRAALSLESYEVEPLSLVSQASVPQDASVVLVAGPENDLLPAELEALDAYLDRGGDLLVLLDPFRAPALAAWLGQRGMLVGDDVVLDPEHRLAGGEALSAVLETRNEQHPVTAALESAVLLSGMRSVKARGGEGRRGFWLLKSGERSWASADAAVLQGGAARFVAGRDLNGPLPVAAALSQPVTKEESAGAVSRLVVVGDADLVRNRFLDYLSNRDFVINAVNWLVRQERLISARAAEKTPGVNWLFVSQRDLNGIFWSAAVIEPALFVLFGLIVLLRRRLVP